MFLHLSHSTYSPVLRLVFILTFRPLGLHCPESNMSIFFFIRAECAWGRRGTIIHLKGHTVRVRKGWGEKGRADRDRRACRGQHSSSEHEAKTEHPAEGKEKDLLDWGRDLCETAEDDECTRGGGGAGEHRGSLMSMGSEALHYPSVPLAELHQTPLGSLRGLDGKNWNISGKLFCPVM